MGRVKERALTAQETGLSAQNFPALKDGHLVNNLAQGENLSLQDLTKVTVPTGGMTLWVMESVDGQKTLEKLEGIVVSQALIRVLYARPFEESGGTEAPVCFSSDSLTGIFDKTTELPEPLQKFGFPTGHCQDCPFSRYGTKPKANGNGRGQACQQRRLLLLLTRESRMPLLVSIPASGLKSAKKYLVGLQALGLEHWQVLSAIELSKTENRDGIKYAKPKFTMLEKLPYGLLQSVKDYKTAIEKQISTEQLASAYPQLPPSPQPEAEAA